MSLRAAFDGSPPVPGDPDKPIALSRTARTTIVVVLASLAWACETKPVSEPTPAHSPPVQVPENHAEAAPAASAVPSATPPRESVRIETVEVEGDAPAFVLRGTHGPHRMVFLHGYCSHGLRYAQSFQHAAAKQGVLIAVQADKPCDEAPFRRWTNTAETLNGRIEAAFRAAGDDASLDGMAIIGYSSGAVLAEMLAHKYPARYAHVILIGGPQKPVEWRLRKSRSTVMIAGENDRRDLMETGARDLDASGIPSTFMILPGAKHGEMGPEGERVMGEALDWLWKNERSI